MNILTQVIGGVHSYQFGSKYMIIFFTQMKACSSQLHTDVRARIFTTKL